MRAVTSPPALILTILGQIDLSPEFQRRGRWDMDRRSRFIESIIMNVPIPPVFLGEDEYGKYVVLDGRQRLTAVHDFLRDIYALKGLEVWPELNGLRYDDLQKRKLAPTITRRFIPAVVILKESSSGVKYDVFDRLNTGVSALSRSPWRLGTLFTRDCLRNCCMQCLTMPFSDSFGTFLSV
jgi:hypothetical protein